MLIYEKHAGKTYIDIDIMHDCQDNDYKPDIW